MCGMPITGLSLVCDTKSKSEIRMMTIGNEQMTYNEKRRIYNM